MKYRLADAMKNCMKKMPVEKITVKEIVTECGTTRQTFYRNFQDKYDLINWYFDRILLESFQHMGEGKTAYEGLVNKFHYIEEEKLFFKAAFRNDDQNCLRDHDFQLILRFYENQIQEKTKQPIPENLHFQLEMYCQGSVFCCWGGIYDNAVGTWRYEKAPGRDGEKSGCSNAGRAGNTI